MSLRSLDALRGALAVYVLVGHCRWLLWSGHSAWLGSAPAAWELPLGFGSGAFRYGREAVMVFFALSGFFIHLRAGETLRAGTAPPQLPAGRFLARRAHRLVAPYGFALLVTVLCDLVGRAWFPALYAGQTGDVLLDQTFARGGYATDNVLPALVLLPSSLGHDFGSNGPLWSLAYEVIYFLLYPAWLAVRRRSALAAFGAVPAACLALTLLPGAPFLPLVLIHYPIWLAGAFLAERLPGLQPSQRSVMLSAALFTAGLLGHRASNWLAASILATILFGGAAVTACALAPDRGCPAWWVRLFEYFGIRSYTIYMVHMPFVSLLGAWLIQAGGRPMHGWFAAGGAVLAIGFSCACFELCERHFLHARLRVGQARA